MRIAIAATRAEISDDASAQIGDHAGRTPYYLIFDGQGTLVETISNPFTGTEHGAGHRTARMLADKNINLVIAGRFGSAMREELSERGIKMSEQTGKVQDALAAAKT